MEETNKIIRFSKMTYKEALHLAWEVLEEKRAIKQTEDTLGLGLANQYEDAIKLLSRLYLRDII